MEWIKYQNKNEIFNNISNVSDFYFNHSYAVIPKDKDLVLSTTIHEIEFASIINFKIFMECNSIQKKSSEAGKTLFKKFFYQFRNNKKSIIINTFVFRKIIFIRLI